MDPFETSHFSNEALIHNLRALVAHDCRTTAVLLTRIAEVEERKLFRQAGYSSMHAYCVHELHFSEGVAYKRTEAARVVRRFSGVLVAVAEGKLHLRAVLMLARHLTAGNADDLVAAAAHKTRFELQQLLAERFPQPDLPERLYSVPAPPLPIPVAAQPAASPVGHLDPDPIGATPPQQLADEQVKASALGFTHPRPPERAEPSVTPGGMTPLAPQRFGFQFTGDQETHELYEQFRALVSHEIPSGEMALVFKAALKLAKAQVEKRKFAATDRPSRSRGSNDPRYIPAAVKRAVCERDHGQCTFVGEAGKRCGERRFLEYDHAEPVACGGKSTAENIRLLCRAHNQLAAERAFGAELMDRKRRDARGAQG